MLNLLKYFQREKEKGGALIPMFTVIKVNISKEPVEFFQKCSFPFHRL